jgi:magnesium-transporting ATPase (P-type)
MNLPNAPAAAAARPQGLPPDEAARRLARDGPNTVDAVHAHRGLRLLLAQFTSPIVLILVAATVLSMALGDLADGLIVRRAPSWRRSSPAAAGTSLHLPSTRRGAAREEVKRARTSRDG